MQPRLSERFLPFKATNMIIWASTAALYCSCWETGWRKTWETWGLWFEFSQFISAISDILSVQPSTAPVRLLNRRKLAVLEGCRLQGLNIQYVIKCTGGSVSLHCKNYKGKRIFVLWMPTERCCCRSTWRKKRSWKSFWQLDFSQNTTTWLLSSSSSASSPVVSLQREFYSLLRISTYVSKAGHGLCPNLGFLTQFGCFFIR